MNDKGFTLIETIFSMTMVMFVILIAMRFPTSLVETYRDYKELHLESSSLFVLNSHLKNDIESSKGEVANQGKTLVIGKAKYTFGEDNIARNEKDSYKIEFKGKPTYSIDKGILTISIGESYTMKYSLYDRFNKDNLVKE